jgi:hypothetical protein
MSRPPGRRGPACTPVFTPGSTMTVPGPRNSAHTSLISRSTEARWNDVVVIKHPGFLSRVSHFRGLGRAWVNRPEFRAYFLPWEGWHVHASQVRPGHEGQGDPARAPERQSGSRYQLGQDRGHRAQARDTTKRCGFFETSFCRPSSVSATPHPSPSPWARSRKSPSGRARTSGRCGIFGNGLAAELLDPPPKQMRRHDHPT